MRSDFLIHWTGKGIHLDVRGLSDGQRSAFVDRLASVLSDGFWMKKPDEKVVGRNGSWIKYEAPMTCFTEIRLSQAKKHASRYGPLGIGVTRRFVLDRFGGPVHYVRNDATECVVGNVQHLIKILEAHHETESLNFLAINAAFIKGMSKAEKDDFECLDEQEWRIVHTHLQTKDGRILPTGLPNPEFRIPLLAGDVGIVVFPDEQTRRQAKSDTRIRPWLDAPDNHGVILLTLAECEQF